LSEKLEHPHGSIERARRHFSDKGGDNRCREGQKAEVCEGSQKNHWVKKRGSEVIR
jgi:hypothetical protein